MKFAESLLARLVRVRPVNEFVVATQVGDVTTSDINSAFKDVFSSHGFENVEVESSISVTDSSIFLRITEPGFADVVLQFYVCPDEGLMVRIMPETDQEVPQLVCLDPLSPSIDKTLSSVDISDLSWITKSAASLLLKRKSAEEAYMTTTIRQPEPVVTKKSVNQGILRNDNGHFKNVPALRIRGQIEKSDVEAFSIVKHLGWRDYKNA